jgi:hypothetical protein
MTLRFLQLVESSAPGYPFVPGQVIDGLSRLTPEQQQWIRDGRAELVRDEPPALAVAVPVERAVRRARGKR